MLSKPLQQLTLDDIQSLVDQEVHEGKVIEYKERLWRLNNSDRTDDLNKQRIEYLKDVSSFANTGGGHIVIGIKDKDAKADSIPGIEEESTDNRIGQLSQLLQAWVKPRINVEFRYILIASSKYVLVIEVQPSTIGPHRVTYDDHNQFYMRDSRGAVRMDIDQLRTAFSLGQVIATRIREFTSDRVSDIFSGKSPIEVRNDPKLIVHMIPQVSFTSKLSFSVEELRTARGNAKALGAADYGTDKINLDGLVSRLGTDSESGLKNVRTYLLLYRNGILEAVNSDIASPDESDGVSYYWRTETERELLEQIPRYIQIFRNLGIQAPIWAFVSIASAKNVYFPFAHSTHRFDRDLLQFPEEIIDSYDLNPWIVVKNIADLIWNAAGFENCASVSTSGEYNHVHKVHG